ncbi:MAG TPA: TerC family protein [Bacteroidia bacterium]|nr:TerC family protein [Bacteroidia bacterium]
MINYQEILTVPGLISLLTLSVLEVVLGIDNVIFIAIVATKLPKKEQAKARAIGLSLALIFRVILLFSISWIMSLKDPFFYIVDFGVTGRDIILFGGGIFLLYKTSIEIFEKIYGAKEVTKEHKSLTLRGAILQIVFIDVVFSFDSILTAVGLVTNVLLMILAVVIAMIFMLLTSGWVSEFINKHPTIKMLALAFLILIGFVLILDSLHLHIDKAYVYAALGFSIMVEMLNMSYRSNSHKREH